MTTLTESDVEASALNWLPGLGWNSAHGPAYRAGHARRRARRQLPGGALRCRVGQRAHDASGDIVTEEWATYGVVTDAHRRRSIRLKGYDYSQPGANFVTIVTQDRLCLFGDVV